MAKRYNVKDLNVAEATKSMVKATSSYDQIELLSMVKQDVHQGEVIINKLNQVIAGTERLEKFLGGGRGGGSRGSSGGGVGEGGGGIGGDGGSCGGGDSGDGGGGGGEDGVDFIV
nr:uncharacterized protein LOC112004494 [Quercus suber]